MQAPSLSRLESEGLVQRFEYTFELASKTLKDLLESRGLTVSFPRDVIKAAFSAELIGDGDAWIEMLDRRSELSHTYDEGSFSQSLLAIRDRFYPALAALVGTLSRYE